MAAPSTLVNSTVSDNTASHGGAVYNGGTLSLNNSTVSWNWAGWGGGIYNHDGSVTLQSTILDGNEAWETGPDCDGSIDSLGHNLIGNTHGCTFTPITGDLIDIDARLFPLIGSPRYHPLLPGSPAIDAGNPAGCIDHLGNPLLTDQRGALRPVDGDGDNVAICDIGSCEYDPANDPLTYIHLPVVIRNQ